MNKRQALVGKAVKIVSHASPAYRGCFGEIIQVGHHSAIVEVYRNTNHKEFRELAHIDYAGLRLCKRPSEARAP